MIGSAARCFESARRSATRFPVEPSWPRPVARALAGLALALALVIPTRALATWQSFNAARDGLADNSVLCLAESHDGALWFGTSLGASRFDGQRWFTFADSLPNLKVFALLEDRQGRKWFGTSTGGLARFDGARWERFDVSTGQLPANQVNVLLEDHRGDVWIGTSLGLVRYEPDADRWTTYSAGAGRLVHPSAWRLLEDRSNNLWIGTPEGVSRLGPDRDTWTSWTQNPAALGRDSVLALGEGRDGSIWFGTDLGAWRLAQDGVWSKLGVTEGLRSPPVLAITCDGLGRMWFGGFTGVARFDGRAVRTDTQTSDGVFIGEVWSLLTDHSGNVWIGTSTSGAYRYDGVTFRHYFSNVADSPGCPSRPSPNIPSLRLLGSNCVSAMLEDHRGELWFGTYNGGTSVLRRVGTWASARRSAGIPVSDSISSLAEDHAGALWLGAVRSGVTQLDSTRTVSTLHSRATGLASDTVRTLYVDRSGDVWVGTTNGAGRWNGTAWTSWLRGGVDGVPVEVTGFLEDAGGRLWMRTSVALFSLDASRATLSRSTAPDGPISNEVTSMIEARDGGLWFGTPRGVSRLQTNAWNTWNFFGTPGDSSVNAVYEDREGGIWVGTDFDAARWNGGSWTSFSATTLGSTPVTGIFQDAGGSMWLATFRGLSRWNGAQWRIYDSRGNGLAADQITGFLEDHHGHLWFSSNAGLTEHEPDRVAPQTVFVNRPAALSSSRTASFVFGAAYGEVADLEYSTSWDGEPYSAWTTENTWSMGAIPDTTHTLEVRSRDLWRNVDPTPAAFTFEVDATPPVAQITSPVFGLPIRGRVVVTGRASDPRFKAFALQARPLGTTSWIGDSVLVLAAGETPVEDGELATWDTSRRSDGDWEMRLSVIDTLGLVGISTVRVIVDNQPPFANVTSPARIVATEGGDVFTTHAETHAYFPPNAFAADAIVTIDTSATALATLPDGAVRVSAAWNIGWRGSDLVKDGVLEMRPYRPTASLAAYVETDGTWRRLGGSPEAGGGVALGLTTEGRFALFSGATAPSGSGGIDRLSITPRAFSPTGGFASSELAIGFTLAREGSVTVKIYNRAGRLVRTVAERMPGVPGDNIVRWNGRDHDGEIVRAGIYLATVEALGETKTKALAVVR